VKRVTQKMSCFLDENDVVMSEHESAGASGDAR
jgi:hypothetical protein